MVLRGVFLLVGEWVKPGALDEFACLLVRDATWIEDRVIWTIVHACAEAQVVVHAGDFSGREGARDGEVDVLLHAADGQVSSLLQIVGTGTAYWELLFGLGGGRRRRLLLVVP